MVDQVELDEQDELVELVDSEVPVFALAVVFEAFYLVFPTLVSAYQA